MYDEHHCCTFCSPACHSPYILPSAVGRANLLEVGPTVSLPCGCLHGHGAQRISAMVVCDLWHSRRNPSPGSGMEARLTQAVVVGPSARRVIFSAPHSRYRPQLPLLVGFDCRCGLFAFVGALQSHLLSRASFLSAAARLVLCDCRAWR